MTCTFCTNNRNSVMCFYTDTRLTDISYLWIVCFVPEERKPFIFSILNPLNMDRALLIWTFSNGPLSVYID